MIACSTNINAYANRSGDAPCLNQVYVYYDRLQPNSSLATYVDAWLRFCFAGVLIEFPRMFAPRSRHVILEIAKEVAEAC